MATAPPFEGTQEDWYKGMKRQTDMLYDRAGLQKAFNDKETNLPDRHAAYLHQQFLNQNDDDFLNGGKKSGRHSKKSRRHSKKSRKSRRHSKKSRKCRR